MTQSLQPSPDNDYQFAPAPNRATLDRAVWAAVMASIGGRLRGLEAQRIEYQQFVDDLKLFALDRLNTAIEPIIADMQGRLDAVSLEQQQLLAQMSEHLSAEILRLNTLISELEDQSQTALQDLSAAVAEAQGRVDAILADGIPADDVSESDQRVFMTPAERVQISDLVARIAAVGEPEGIAALDEDGFVPVAQVRFSTQAEAEAGVSEGGVMNPLLVAQAISALTASGSKMDVFTTSGTFTREDDDVLYIVEMWAGGGGGNGAFSLANHISVATAGGSSSWLTMSVTGGLAGTTAPIGGTGGGVPVPVTSDVYSGGAAGSTTLAGSSVYGGGGGSMGGSGVLAVSGSSVYGGGGGGGGGSSTGTPPAKIGGTSLHGGAGGNGGALLGPGTAGSIPGGGGGGAGHVAASGTLPAPYNRTSTGGGGGGGGGYLFAVISASKVGATSSVVVGAGGAGGISGVNGGNGGRGEVRITRIKG